MSGWVAYCFVFILFFLLFSSYCFLFVLRLLLGVFRLWLLYSSAAERGSVGGMGMFSESVDECDVECRQCEAVVGAGTE